MYLPVYSTRMGLNWLPVDALRYSNCLWRRRGAVGLNLSKTWLPGTGFRPSPLYTLQSARRWQDCRDRLHIGSGAWAAWIPTCTRDWSLPHSSSAASSSLDFQHGSQKRLYWFHCHFSTHRRRCFTPKAFTDLSFLSSFESYQFLSMLSYCSSVLRQSPSTAPPIGLLASFSEKIPRCLDAHALWRCVGNLYLCHPWCILY